MLKNRKGSRRAFTVETRGGGRGRPLIPSRATAPDTVAQVSWPAAPEPQAPAPEARRILPSLIEPEPDEAIIPEPRRRGRPRKAPPAIAEPVAESIAAVAPVPAPKPATGSLSPTKRIPRLAAALPPGERWKRRLPRWSR